MERYIRNGIEILEFCAKQDAQALQYSLIVKSLLDTCLKHIQQKELSERLARIKASSELFGLQVGIYQNPSSTAIDGSTNQHDQAPFSAIASEGDATSLMTMNGFATPDWEELDIRAFGELPNNIGNDIFGSLNLFPMFENF